MVGAVVLARAADGPALSDEILRAVTTDLAGRSGRTARVRRREQASAGDAR
jgi:hypothetical protein